MTSSLEAIRDRLRWARKRYDELDALCSTVTDIGPSVFVGIDGPQPGFHLRLELGDTVWAASVEFTDQLPTDLAFLTGEILLAMRGSLDNLAWLLVEANGGRATGNIVFPIFRRRSDFESRAGALTGRMSAAAQSAIERLQPFNDEPEHPDQTILALISRLNNIDKHELVHHACMWLSSMDVHWGDPRVEVVGFRDVGCVTSGEELARLKTPPWRRRGKYDQTVSIDASFDVALTNPGHVQFLGPDGEPMDGMPMRAFFETALDYLDATVVPAFEGEFA